MGNSKQSFIKTTSFILNLPPFPVLEELPPPQAISITPLDNTRLTVEWTAALNQSESSFVVQWTSLPYREPTSLHWEHINETARNFIVTGLKSHSFSTVSMTVACWCGFTSYKRLQLMMPLIYLLCSLSFFKFK